MTRKRYIKLLMGRYGYDRNAARHDARLIQEHQRMLELLNHHAKILNMTKENICAVASV